MDNTTQDQSRHDDGFSTKIRRITTRDFWVENNRTFVASVRPALPLFGIITVALLGVFAIAPEMVLAQSAINVDNMQIPGDAIAETAVNFFNAFQGILVLIGGLAIGAYVIQTVARLLMSA